MPRRSERPYAFDASAASRDSGWIEGQNLVLGVFLTDGRPEDAERLVPQMLATNPEVIVVFARDVYAVHGANAQPCVQPDAPVLLVACRWRPAG